VTNQAGAHQISTKKLLFSKGYTLNGVLRFWMNLNASAPLIACPPLTPKTRERANLLILFHFVNLNLY
jgi:hypothetical protein